MNEYTCKLFAAGFHAQDGDYEGKRVEKATHNFGHDGEACYVIYINGRMNTIQFESDPPYPGSTFEAAAQNHIAELKKQEG